MTISSPKVKIYQFPYTRQSALGADELVRFKFFPFLKIGLMRDSRLIKMDFAYIDTGCQWCLFDKAYAKLVGIDDYKNSEFKPVEIAGIAGSGEHKEHMNIGYFHKLKLVVYKDTKKLKLKNAWVIETEVGFVEKSFGLPAILGVRGFLDRFSFKANIPKHYFELEPLFDVSD